MSGRDLLFFRAAPYQGIQELNYPFHDKTVLVTNCAAVCVCTAKRSI